LSLAGRRRWDELVAYAPVPQVMRALTRAILCLMLSVMMTSIVTGQQIIPNFRCDSHTVEIDRLPGAKSIPAKEPDKQISHRILQADFSGFDPQYNLETVRFVLFFDPTQSALNSPYGKLRILTLLRSHGSDQWRELTGDRADALEPAKARWYDNFPISYLLDVTFEPPQAGEENALPDDPLVSESGRPQARVHQAQKGTPVFLLKFIGLTSAGGHGVVETERAIVLDLRGGELAAPAAVGCIKNDFASEQHKDEWIDCQWNHKLQDYVCRNNTHYKHDWDFLLIKGEKLPSNAKARR